MNLDFSSWEEYKFEDLFKMKRGFFSKKPEHYEKGNIRFLTSTGKNNGVSEFYTLDEIDSTNDGRKNKVELSKKIFPRNAICVNNNGSVGCAFFQDKEFASSSDVTTLYLIEGEFNKYTALFVATVIQHDKYRWSYGRKWGITRMKKSLLKLPSKNGKPDWEFMENYIKSLNIKSLTTNNTESKLKLNTTEWAEFRLGDLFDEIYNSKANVKDEMEISEIKKESYLPFISRTEENNGCDCYVSVDTADGVEKGNAIIIGDTTSTIFYQKDKFATGAHIIVCRAKWINMYTALFIKTVIEKERYKYSYGRAFKKDLIEDTIIKLPVCEDNTPDWNFMEEYIKQLPYADNLAKVF
ncbi:restriction endonuclease subunit S [uncultured Methanobrevibacter sp.]|uniref:restriction endonuclease subunit S n=1 Tax=uncultured Methanobrevibacter sp. TaxID=253161 RepID=UPI0025F2581A|nr:restriction endonuclease subunit S [uncultured Methanobrevibacter sp.]